MYSLLHVFFTGGLPSRSWLHRQPPARMPPLSPADKSVYRAAGGCIDNLTRTSPMPIFTIAAGAVPRLSCCTTTPLPNPPVCGSSLLKRALPYLSSSEVANYCLASSSPFFIVKGFGVEKRNRFYYSESKELYIQTSLQISDSRRQTRPKSLCIEAARPFALRLATKEPTCTVQEY